MWRALELARRGQPYVAPNPMVGAVIVKDGQIVGEGFHEEFGGAHAEANAIRMAGDKAKGATMYVSLEPCCEAYDGKKTPPCVPQIAAAGLSRVVVAVQDPPRPRPPRPDDWTNRPTWRHNPPGQIGPISTQSPNHGTPP